MHFSLKGWENILFELDSERVNGESIAYSLDMALALETGRGRLDLRLKQVVVFVSSFHFDPQSERGVSLLRPLKGSSGRVNREFKQTRTATAT